jgi:hypothetical protein
MRVFVGNIIMKGSLRLEDFGLLGFYFVLGKFSDKAQLHKDDMHLYIWERQEGSVYSIPVILSSGLGLSKHLQPCHLVSSAW